MHCGGEGRQWSCGKPRSVNLLKVGSIVRDIGEPCLSQSLIKVVIAVSRMLKPEKWQASFDSDGKVSQFQKALKLIALGGVEPSIRAEVWEFLLGCYALGTTTDFRRQLRTARRERYEDLVKQCRQMHSSIGTGSLAYVVGSRVMDMRTSSKIDEAREAEAKSQQASIDECDKLERECNRSNCTDSAYDCQRESSCDSTDLVSGRSTDSAAYNSSCFINTSGTYDCGSPDKGRETEEPNYLGERYFDFPSLPVTDLFEKGEDHKQCGMQNDKPYVHHNLIIEDSRMHSFQINNNVDLIMESNGSSSDSSHPKTPEIEMVCPDVHDRVSLHNTSSYKKEIVNRLRISDVPEMPLVSATTLQGGAASEEKVSEWLWTLHRIVVDVVRTDCHLEFYEDTRNLARMSDILAVYAWIDPSTGYCQGMSDLLSPFVVLFEDDADAFWCFEMLLRRMRANFQMEGPTGVMKQLEALWHILEFTDKEMFAHLSQIGAESLHFAFPMLLVLFRRELSFNDSLRMWEMMWAADFDESLASNLEENCLDPLVVQLPRDCAVEITEETPEKIDGSSNGGSQSKHKNIGRSTSDIKGGSQSKRKNIGRSTSDIKGGSLSKHNNLRHSTSDNIGMRTATHDPFCGLGRSFWAKNLRMHHSTLVSAPRNGDEELPVFCVAAILISNRYKIIKETRSIDDMIKIFNDKRLKINVKRCIRKAIKVRKRYLFKSFYERKFCFIQLVKSKIPPAQNAKTNFNITTRCDQEAIGEDSHRIQLHFNDRIKRSYAV
ncbi:uncharacterized protein [Rutidosis leptorrhynchoides]|uniref:uncharacterized protein n=1 Tax=Rutidosis leptorrhynchoides TaxID=125765 RepID=UPI003A999F27